MRCLTLLSLSQQLLLALSMQTAILSHDVLYSEVESEELQKPLRGQIPEPSSPVDNTATSSAVCNITEEDGILLQTITLEEQSNATGAKISLKAKQEIPLSVNDKISAWGGTTGSVSIWHDSDLLFSKRSTIFPNNQYEEVIQWGPLIKEANQTSYSVDCSGVLTGNIDGKKFKPVHYPRVRHGLVFEDGTSLPNLGIPDTVNVTLYSVLGNLEQGIRLCTGKPARDHPRLALIL
ncbi:hypothetical protein BJX62DRAFT_238289 [Aspergillus germanicus]